MNRHESDYNQQQGGYRTRRSEEYRHPEMHSGHHMEDYGSSARGGYGNEGNRNTYSNQGNQMSGSRNFSRVNITDDDTYSTSRNYGNMGSYGGAQGFGDVRGGYSSQRHYDSDTNYKFDSGMGSPREARSHHYSPAGHPAYQNRSSSEQRNQGWVSGQRSGSDRDLYGSYANREFQGQRQGRYDFERDEYTSPSYGGDRGQYIGSGYDRYTQGDYGPSIGNYGTHGIVERGSAGMPYGMSGYYSGGYGPQDYGNSHNRDIRDFERY
ncbi:hypothetical protein [Pontibacter ruber]|uniref:SWFGD domain-containing protein n=1 Tax=Pontibacter ruber TaxID=1343895 RepID=A0ABW5CTS5_9BACT|nr:hypothetical protein [Pontibacter ruber]